MKTTAERIAIIKAGLEKSRQRCTSETQFLDGVAHLIDSLNCIIENRTSELERTYERLDKVTQEREKYRNAFEYASNLSEIIMEKFS